MCNARSPHPVPVFQVQYCFHKEEQREKSLMDTDCTYFVIEVKIEAHLKML